jgi:hypothetical protein
MASEWIVRVYQATVVANPTPVQLLHINVYNGSIFGDCSCTSVGKSDSRTRKGRHHLIPRIQTSLQRDRHTFTAISDSPIPTLQHTEISERQVRRRGRIRTYTKERCGFSQHADDAFSKEDCMCIGNGDRKYVKYICVSMRCLSETLMLSLR